MKNDHSVFLPCPLLSGRITAFFPQTLPRHHWRDSILYFDLWSAFSQCHVIFSVSDGELTSGTTQPAMRSWNDRKHSFEPLEVCTLLLLGLTWPFSISHKTAFKLFTNSPESINCGLQGRTESRRKEEGSMLFCLKQQSCHQGVMWFGRLCQISSHGREKHRDTNCIIHKAVYNTI